MAPVRGTVTKILGASSTVDCGPAGVFQCGLRSLVPAGAVFAWRSVTGCG